MTIKVAFVGLGKMGRAAAKKVLETEGLEVVAAFDVSGLGSDVGILVGSCETGIKVEDPARLAKTLKTLRPDVVVDFTQPEATLKNSRAVAAAGVNMVIGTTGFTDKQMNELVCVLKGVGAVISPNMSVGVNVFWKLVGEAAKELKGYDVEVVEAHHRFKKDAPSGTALKAVKVICDATGRDIGRDVVYGRHGDSKRRDGEIGVHSIRAGDIVGEHTVMFTTLGERFEVRHVAHSRDSLASGIPAALRFIRGKKGIYDMADVLGLR
jgi:4-hydroxy-tetrahydrodipicolinate reductase